MLCWTLLVFNCCWFEHGWILQTFQSFSNLSVFPSRCSFLFCYHSLTHQHFFLFESSQILSIYWILLDITGSDCGVLFTVPLNWVGLYIPNDVASHCIMFWWWPSSLPFSFLDDSFRKNLESALRFGNPLLVQDVENYDPILNPVLNHELRRTGGRVLITLGDVDIDFTHTFTIFLTTRDPSVSGVTVNPSPQPSPPPPTAQWLSLV